MSICRSLHRRMGFSDTIFSGPVYWKESVTFYKGDANKLKDEVMSTSYGARGSIREGAGGAGGAGHRLQAAGATEWRRGVHDGGRGREAWGVFGVEELWGKAGPSSRSKGAARGGGGWEEAGRVGLDVWGARARAGGEWLQMRRERESRKAVRRSVGQAVRRKTSPSSYHTHHSPLTTHPSPHTHSPASSCVFLHLPASSRFCLV